MPASVAANSAAREGGKGRGYSWRGALRNKNIFMVKQSSASTR